MAGAYVMSRAQRITDAIRSGSFHKVAREFASDLDSATALATPATIVKRDGGGASALSTLICGEIRGEDADEGNASGDLYLRGGRPHVGDMGGAHTHGNILPRMGLCDQSFESAQFAFFYGDQRLGLPEGEYAVCEIGFYSEPTYDPYVVPGTDPPRTITRTPNTFRMHCASNPVTGAPINLDVFADNGWARLASQGKHLALEAASKFPIVSSVRGPNGPVAEYLWGHKAPAANGAVTIDLFGYDFDLGDQWVPYQRNGYCVLDINAQDASFNNFELWKVAFIWRGGHAGTSTAAQVFGKLAAPNGPTVLHSFCLGTGRGENPTSTDGIISLDAGTGANASKIRIRYTGVAAVNMNQIAATLRVMVPAL